VGNRCANALSYCLPPIVSDGHVRRDGRRRQFARVVQTVVELIAPSVSVGGNDGPESLVGDNNRPTSAPIPAEAPTSHARRVNPGRFVTSATVF